MPNALIELLAKQKQSDPSTPVPALLQTAVQAKIEAQPQTKVTNTDPGVAVKVAARHDEILKREDSNHD